MIAGTVGAVAGLIIMGATGLLLSSFFVDLCVLGN